MKKNVSFVFAALTLLCLVSCKPSTPAVDHSKTSANDPDAVVATIGSEKITNRDLDEEIGERVHQMKRQALDQMITMRLLKPKAKAAGKSIQEYVQSEIYSKITPPSEAEIKTMYDKAKPGNPSLPPLDQVRPRIVEILTQQKSNATLQAHIQQLKDAAGGVKITLGDYEAPRKTNVEAKGFMRGDEKAKVTIVEFSDFQCPYCGAVEPTVKRVLKEYEGKVRFFFRDFPLPNHEHAIKASEAAHCASDQGKYWEMHDKLFENQTALDVASLKGYAKTLGLDTAKFDKCLDSGEKAKAVMANLEAGQDLNVSSTPAFFINGVSMNGALPFEQFKKVIDAELAK